MDDPIQRFARSRDPDAFRLIVDRHINQVYAQARRELRDAAQAEDVVQAVFVLLVQEAPKLSSRIILGGWLHRATHYACSNVRRSEHRRKRHEQASAIMRNEISQESGSSVSWDEIAPVLDEALDRLPRHERETVVMRYMENLSTSQIGEATGASEVAVRQRLSRGIAKLRKLLGARGVGTSALALTALLETNLIHPPSAPAALAAAVSGAAIHSAPASSLAIAHGVAHMFFLTKLKFAALFLLAVSLIAAVCVPVIAMAMQAPVVPTTAASSPPPAKAVPHSLVGAIHKLDDAFRSMDPAAVDECFIYSEPRELDPWWQLVQVNLAGLRLQKAVHDVYAVANSPIPLAQPAPSDMVAGAVENESDIVEPASGAYSAPLAETMIRVFERKKPGNPMRQWMTFHPIWRKVDGVWKWDVRGTVSFVAYDPYGKKLNVSPNPNQAKDVAAMVVDMCAACDDFTAKVRAGHMTIEELAAAFQPRLNEVISGHGMTQLEPVPNPAGEANH